MACSVPILIILFNRPDNARYLIDKLRIVKPLKLFIAIDGPRLNHAADKKGVEDCIKLIDSIDWPCQIYKKISLSNLGCGQNVSSAINWFFSEIDEGIILEDDCIPSEAFFTFCEVLLAKFRHQPKAMLISGNRWNEEYPIETDYFFSLFTSTWGWATWRRAWLQYDYRMSDWPKVKHSSSFQEWLKLPAIKSFWLSKLESYYKHIAVKVDNWDFQWQYTVFRNQGLVITPRENLVQNIGTQGVHTYSSEENIHFKPTATHFKIIKEPDLIQPYYGYDEYHCKQLLKKQPTLYDKLGTGFKQVVRINTTYIRNKLNKIFK